VFRRGGKAVKPKGASSLLSKDMEAGTRGRIMKQFKQEVK